MVAAETVTWVAEHIWEIGLTVAACFALAVAASMWLERWADRRGARFAAAHGILSRADVILAAPPPAAGLPRQQRAAIAPVQIHFHGLDDEQQAEIMGRALPRKKE